MLSVSCGLVGELKFYQELAPQLPIPVPILYHGQHFLGADVFILMSDAGKPCPDSTTFSGSEEAIPLVTQAVKNLASFQAKFWNNKRAFAQPFLKTTLSRRNNALTAILVDMSAEKVWKMYGNGNVFPGSWTSQHLHNVLAIRAKALPYLASLPQVVAHGDYRLGNMLAHMQQNHKPLLTTVDWQGHFVSHAYTDLSFLICTDLPVDVRREHERELVNLWKEKLSKNGVLSHELEDAWENYILGILDYALFIWVVGSSYVDMKNTEALRQMSTWFSRCITALEDHNVSAILQQIQDKYNLT